MHRWQGLNVTSKLALSQFEAVSLLDVGEKLGILTALSSISFNNYSELMDVFDIQAQPKTSQEAFLLILRSLDEPQQPQCISK